LEHRGVALGAPCLTSKGVPIKHKICHVMCLWYRAANHALETLSWNRFKLTNRRTTLRSRPSSDCGICHWSTQSGFWIPVHSYFFVSVNVCITISLKRCKDMNVKTGLHLWSLTSQRKWWRDPFEAAISQVACPDLTSSRPVLTNGWCSVVT